MIANKKLAYTVIDLKPEEVIKEKNRNSLGRILLFSEK